MTVSKTVALGSIPSAPANLDVPAKEPIMYRQCRLEQGTARQVAWIEDRGAKLDAQVELKDGSGRWKVASVGPSVSHKQAIAMRDAHRTQREASDI